MQLANHRGSNIHGIEPVGAGGKSSKLLNFFVQLLQLLDNGLQWIEDDQKLTQYIFLGPMCTWGPIIGSPCPSLQELFETL